MLPDAPSRKCNASTPLAHYCKLSSWRVGCDSHQAPPRCCPGPRPSPGTADGEADSWAAATGGAACSAYAGPLCFQSGVPSYFVAIRYGVGLGVGIYCFFADSGMYLYANVYPVSKKEVMYLFHKRIF